jgi:hypothetical protein
MRSLGTKSHGPSSGDKKLRRELLADARRYLRAIRKGVLQAAIEHKRLGLPMVVYEGGKIREISADAVIRANRNGHRRR